MAEGEGRNEGEDLFEDLDKFFAPIQDVDWPETEQPRAPGPSTPPPARAEGEEDSPETRPETREDTAALEAPLRIETDEDDEDLHDEGAAEAGLEPTPGQEDLFGTDTAPEPISVWAAGRSGAGDEEDVSAGSDATGGVEDEEGEDLSDEAITEEAFAQAPSAYVDLPGAAEEPEETRVAELLEEGTEPEVRPDLDEVEAAAEHFAESVREEVRVEPSPGGPVETEEVEIASLLGDKVEEVEEVEPARAVRVGPEGLGGPSWQEPTALEVGAESERRGPGRDVPMAFLTGLVLAALALGAIAIGAGPFALLAGLIVLFAQGEFYFALQRRHYQPATALGLVTGALVLAAGYFRNEAAMLAVASLGTFATFLWYMTVPIQHRRNVVSNIALTILGVLYVPVLAGYALAVLKLPDGRGLALSIIGLTIVYDVSAFGVGYFWGSRPLAPNVSPKKSWEGAIGATLVVIAVAVGAVAPAVSILDTVGRSVGLAVVVAIFAPLGDLAESLLKRDLGLKDMGSVLPGHGGVLDRIDAVLFVAPAAFLFLRLILL